ncbi:MAG TPA: hypothetical protein VGC11_05755 [Acidimicrobiia bacterium]|jgi:septal ring-binding cell division protein DamX
MNIESQKQLAGKAMYAAIGAPVVYVRKLRDYGDKLAGYSDKLSDQAQTAFSEWAKEGEKVAKQLQEGKVGFRPVVEEIQSRVDLEKVQDRVEKLRDQLEDALTSWRESFSPAAHKDAGNGAAAKTPAKAPAATAPAKKAPAKKAPAKKARATAPSAKAATAKPAAKTGA